MSKTKLEGRHDCVFIFFIRVQRLSAFSFCNDYHPFLCRRTGIAEELRKGCTGGLITLTVTIARRCNKRTTFNELAKLHKYFCKIIRLVHAVLVLIVFRLSFFYEFKSNMNWMSQRELFYIRILHYFFYDNIIKSISIILFHIQNLICFFFPFFRWVNLSFYFKISRISSPIGKS